MKKLIFFFIACGMLLLASCDDSKRVDLHGEFQSRPGVGLSLEDGTNIPGFEGNYCTASVCMENPDPDFSTLTHTSVKNGELLIITIGNTSDEVESVSVELIKQNGDRFNRDHPIIQKEPYVFAIEEPFNTVEAFVSIHVRVDLVNEGRTNFYFPVELLDKVELTKEK